jgi:hypothetical protein
MCEMIHTFPQNAVWLHQECQFADATSFATGKTRCGSMADCNQSAVLIAEGKGRCDGKGMGRCRIAYNTVRFN